VELPTTPTVAPSPLPIHGDLVEASIEHNISNLRDTPHPPIIRESALLSTFSSWLEVNVKACAIGDRVEELLLKKVLETGELLSVHRRLSVLWPTEDVYCKYPAGFESATTLLKVSQERFALLKHKVAEIKRANDICSRCARSEYISLNNLNPIPSCRRKLTQIVRPPVLERLRVDIKTYSPFLVVELDPLATQFKSRAEILTHDARLTLGKFPIDSPQKTSIVVS
jgi:hypothetical protein